MSILKQNRDFIRKIRTYIKDGFKRDEEVWLVTIIKSVLNAKGLL